MQIVDYDAYIFDLDGVVWRGDAPITGISDTIKLLRTAGREIRFLTNNAKDGRDCHAAKLNMMGIEAPLEEIISAGWAASAILHSKFGPCQVFVMGTDDLKSEFRATGHTVVDTVNVINGALEPKVEWVVVGYDREFSWSKLDQAFMCIYYGKSKFLACNQDLTFPEATRLCPGIGPSIAALSACTKTEPDLVVGKPNKPIMEALLTTLSCPATRCLMIGDKMETDIIGAAAAGMATLFVLSGIGTKQDLKESPLQPSYVALSAPVFFGVLPD